MAGRGTCSPKLTLQGAHGVSETDSNHFSLDTKSCKPEQPWDPGVRDSSVTGRARWGREGLPGWGA